MTRNPSARDVIEVFLRRKVMFTLICGIVLLIGGAYLLVKQPTYESNAALVLHFDSQSVPDIDRMREPSQLQGSNEHREILYSDADILRGRDRAREVIQAIGLKRMFPEIAALNLSDERRMDLAERAFSAALVIDVGLQSDVITLNYFSPDPVVARDALRHLIDRFFAQEAEIYANPQLTFADQEANAAQQKLTAAQDALADFKAKHQIADLPQQISQLLLSHTDVESRARVAQGHLLEARQRQDALKQLLDDIPPSVSSSAIGEQYHAADDAETKLDALRAKRSEMGSNYLPNSDVFKQLDAQIASLSTAVKERTSEARSRTTSQPNVVYQSIRTDYVRAQADAAGAEEPARVLNDQLTKINQQLNDLETQRNRYDDLTRAVQIQNDTYHGLAIRRETARIEANRNAQRISAAAVITAPMQPATPSRPRRKLVALTTLLTALLLSTMSVLLVEGFDDRLRTASNVKRLLHLPVLASFTAD